MRSEQGFSVVEMLVAASLGLLLLGALGGTLVSGLRTVNFGANQSSSLDGARLVLNQVQRDLQGSRAFQNCTQPADLPGSCILIIVQPPSGPDQTVRYRLVGTELFREVDDGTGTFPSSTLMSDRLSNGLSDPPRPLFACTAGGPLLQVAVSMVVQPNPSNAPTFDLETVVRPRNAYLPASC